MKVLICFGTRPEAIKLAPIIHELRKKSIQYKVCVTAQHREMLDQVLHFFEIIPDYDLNLMEPNQRLNTLSGRILISIDDLLQKEKPDLVMVHGDTTTSVMIAWAAFHRQVQVAHIEAGLRTYNSQSPFPEEINRQITARLSKYHFAPTAKAKENLENEKIDPLGVFITGNTIVDALEFGRKKLKQFGSQSIVSILGFQLNTQKKIILVTGHRRENLGDGLAGICEALLHLGSREDITIIYPVHLNPNIRSLVFDKLKNCSNIHLIDPVPYPVMLWLMNRCELIISDSGGIQEEAPSFGKKVLVTRQVSERLEGINAGFSILVGTNKEKIISEAIAHLEAPPLTSSQNPYGDGKAAKRIVRILKSKMSL